MNTNAIFEQLQKLHGLIDGVRTAPTIYPGDLQTDDLPCVLVYPLEAEHIVPWHQGWRQDREWLVRIYVMPIVQGEGTNEGIEACRPFIDRFAELYFRPSIIAIATGEWRELELISDSGIRADLQLHGVGEQLYWGIEFRLIIKTKEPVTA